MSSNLLPSYASIATKLKLKRVVFAVNVQGDELGENITFDETCKLLSDANVNYTILKFGDVRKMKESKFPYRIVRGSLPLPSDGDLLGSEDLMRVNVLFIFALHYSAK